MPVQLQERALPKGFSAPATTKRVIELLDELDWSTARLADVGAGRGHFSVSMALHLERLGLEAREHVFACDAVPESFEAEGLECARVPEDGVLPFDDESFDAVVSIEVIEHVEDQFSFLRELTRIAKPGGLVIVTTPNVLSMSSRLRTLLTGFPALFDPLPLEDADARLMSGHIHPIGPYFLSFGALRAGLVDMGLFADRARHGSVLLAALLGPLLFATRLGHRARLRKKRPGVLEENRRRLGDYEGLPMLTSRSVILAAHKPKNGSNPPPAGGGR